MKLQLFLSQSLLGMQVVFGNHSDSQISSETSTAHSQPILQLDGKIQNPSQI